MPLPFFIGNYHRRKEFRCWIQKNRNFLYFLLDTFVRMRYNK